MSRYAGTFSLFLPNPNNQNSTKPESHGVSIFFLSQRNSCRSQMAEAILRSFDEDLVIRSAGLSPVDHVSTIAIEVMAEIGINLEQKVPKPYEEFINQHFDYLITVSEGTNEEFEIPEEIKYTRKLHLGFRSPYMGAKCQDEIREKCREVRDEIYNELDYFYNRILKKSVC